MAIVTRETTAPGVTNKSAPLTNAELDNNFVELSQRYKQGDSAEFASVTLASIDIGAFTWAGDVAGDYYVAINAYHDGTNWLRVDTAKVAWLYQHSLTNNMVFEGYKAASVWSCQPGTNPINGFTNVGGWLLATSISEYGDFTIGGNGIEVDGNFTTPYGRFIHSTVGGLKYTGILTNVYLDYSGRDNTAEPSLFAGWVDDGAGLEIFKVQRSPAGPSLAWEDLFTVTNTGNVGFAGTLSGNGYGLTNIPATNIVYDGGALNTKLDALTASVNENAMSVGSGFKAMTAYDSGIASKWIEPIAVSRYERGVPYAYWGSTDGAGNQKVNRCNLSSGAIETKTVNSAYTVSPNDHFAPAINFLRSGKIFIGCTGHNQDQYVTYDVFDDWASVGQLTKQFAHPLSPVGYVQCVNINFRTYIFSRMYNSGTDNWSWVYFYSDDDFTTVSASYVMLQEQADQLYMLFRTVDRSKSTGDDTDSIVRFLSCSNASNMTDRRLMRGTLSYNEVSEFFEYNTSGANVQMDTGGTTFGNLIEIYAAPVGKRFRLSDLADGNVAAALIIEFDEADPYGNAKNYLLLIQGSGTPATKVEIPVPVGVSLPYPTYFTESCFMRPESPAQQTADGIEIMVSVDDGGYNGDYLIYLMTYSLTNDSWTQKLVSRISSTVGRYYRPLPVKGGLADMMCPVVREYDTNPPSPAYKNFNGRSELFWGFSRTNRVTPSQHTAKVSHSNGVELLERQKLTVSQTLSLAYANKELPLDFGTAGTLTIPKFTKAWFQPGDKMSLPNIGTTTVTLDAPAGVLLNGVDGGSCTIDPKKGSVLSCEGKDVWSVIGGNSDVS